jgi:hypothetical protein
VAGPISRRASRSRSIAVKAASSQIPTSMSDSRPAFPVAWEPNSSADTQAITKHGGKKGDWLSDREGSLSLKVTDLIKLYES